MIYGLQKLSLIDYPNEMSFVIFLGGCNFKCPYCHNKSIVFKTTKIESEENVLSMLKERVNFIKHVVITGGEPTIYGQRLIDLIKKIKSIGYKIKLDTNGTNPDLLREIIKLNLIDYFAMDIKNSFGKYNETCGVEVDTNKIMDSIRIIESSNIPYVFRITLNKTMHTEEDINKVKSYIKDKDNLKLQEYKYSKEQIIDKDFGTYN